MTRTTGTFILLAAVSGCISFTTQPADQRDAKGRSAAVPGPTVPTWAESRVLPSHYQRDDFAPSSAATARAMAAESFPPPAPPPNGPTPASLASVGAPASPALPGGKPGPFSALPSAPLPPITAGSALNGWGNAPVGTPYGPGNTAVAQGLGHEDASTVRQVNYSPLEPVGDNAVTPAQKAVGDNTMVPAPKPDLQPTPAAAIPPATLPPVPPPVGTPPAAVEAAAAGDPTLSLEPKVVRAAPMVRLVNTKRITLNFEANDVGPAGLAGVQVWYTQDCKEWKKHEVPPQAHACVIEVEDEGMYGFSLRGRNGAGKSSAPPAVGDLPQVWVMVDLTPPSADVEDVQATVDAVTVRWKASDKTLAPQPISLFYKDATRKGAAWVALASNLENTGKYVWQVPPTAPGKILVRVEAADLAGNVGRAEWKKPVLTRSLPPELEITTVGASIRDTGNKDK